MNQPHPEPVAEEAVETAIAEYHPIASAIAGLRSKYVGLVYDVASPAGMAECRKARAEVRKHRTTLESVRQQIKAPALDLCRRIDADAKAITQALLAIEDPLDQQVRTEEAAAEARREAKRQADLKRQAELRRMVESINAWPLSCLGSSADEIREAIARYEETGPSEPDIPPYYQEEAASAKVRALDKLREMLASRVEWEAEEVRLAAERERQAAEDERLREERQQIEAEQQRQEALRQQAVREAAAERERWAKEQAAERAESERRATEERAELDKQRVEHARIERELAEERARIAAERAREEPGPARQEEQEETAVEVRFQDGVLTEVDPAPVAFQAEAEPVPSDAEVLRDLAHVLERGGEPYGWMPNRLRRMADSFEVLAEPATIMRVRFEKLGGHYHCRVFTSPRPGAAYEKRGDLAFRESEWPDIPLLMRNAEFVEETSGWP